MQEPETVRVLELGRMPYGPALTLQRNLQRAVIAGEAPDTLLLLEHDPVVTLGRRGDRSGILSAQALARAGIAVVATERGGNVTYHGPGQLVAYAILDLRRFGTDLRRYISRLEGTVLEVLAAYGVDGHRDLDQRGVFTSKGKIASLGVHVSHWVTMHGVALNVDPDMAHWDLIAPCAQPGVRAASLADHVQPPPPMPAVTRAFADAFALHFDVRTLPEIPAHTLALPEAEDARRRS